MAEGASKGASPFGAEARLHRREQIELVKSRGQSEVGRHTVVVVLADPPEGSRRLACLISRRFDLHAVVRNRARRLFRETWRALFPRLSPCWVLLIPRRALKSAKCPEILAEVERVLVKRGVCRAQADDGETGLAN
jgi:ribonuclease P protein component